MSALPLLCVQPTCRISKAKTFLRGAMSIVCPACKQENKDKDPAYCSFCYHPFKGAKAAPIEEDDDYVDMRNTTHPARYAFSPVLTKRYDLTGPIKAVIGVLLLCFIAFVSYNALNGGFYYPEDEYDDHGNKVQVYHFHIIPRNTGAKGSAKPGAKPESKPRQVPVDKDLAGQKQ